jgi:hypothetical protein
VEVFIPQMKADEGGENLPCRPAQRARRGVRGSRSGRTRTRSTRRIEKREVSNLAAHSSPAARPPKTLDQTRTAIARRRFVNWVDRRVNVIKDDVIAGLDVEDLLEWESTDFHPTRVPWTAPRRRENFGSRCTHQTDAPWHRCFRWEVDWRLRRAWGRRCALLRALTEKKGRSPPPLYVEKGMAVKLRTWSSGSGEALLDGYTAIAWAPPPTILPTRREVQRSPRVRYDTVECRHRAHRTYTTCPSGHGVAAGHCRCRFCDWRR